MGNPKKFCIKLRNVIPTMREQILSFLAMSKVQWTGSGTRTIDDTTVLYFGLAEKKVVTKEE